MIPMGDGNYRLEFKDWCYVGVGAVAVLGSMVAVGWGLDQLRKRGERDTERHDSGEGRRR